MAIDKKIRFGEKFSYFLANLGNIPVMTLLSSYFLIFYTDVVGLDPAKLATLFLISKIVDGISDPVMGFILDKFPVTKMGKFRPMLIIGTVICCINYILLWFGAAWIPVGKYVIVYITYLLLGLTFDMMDISLNGMLPVITADNKERAKLSLVKAIGYLAGGIVISVAAPLIVAEATLENYYVLIFGSTAIVLVFSVIGALGVKERVTFENRKEERYGIKELLRILGAKPVLATFATSLLVTIGSTTASGANTYFYTYIMGDLTLMAGVTLVSMVGIIPGIFASTVLSAKIGKKNTQLIGIVVTAIGVAIRLFDPTSLMMIYITSIIGSIGGGLILPLGYAIQADNTTYIQYTTGKRAEAAIASLNSFITKVGQGVAGALPGYLLAAFGFVTGATEQPESIHTAIMICVLVIPLVFGLLGGLVFAVGYKVTAQDVEKMTQTVAARSAAD